MIIKYYNYCHALSIIFRYFVATIQQKKAVITLDNGTIHIHPVRGKSKWRIQMPLYQGDKKEFRALIPPTGILRLEQDGPYLELDPVTHALQLVSEIQIDKDKYLSFKNQLDAFIRLSQEWQEIAANTSYLF